MIAYNRLMYKLPKIVLIFEPNPESGKTYNGILESSGFYAQLVHEEVDFYEECLKVIPDIIVLNGTSEKVNEENICKKLRKHKFLKYVPIVVLVEKIGFSNTEKAKQTGVELEEFPLKNNHFLQKIKKISKSVVMPQVHLKDDNELRSKVYVELDDISEMHISFVGPVKLNNHCNIQLSANLLDSLGIVEKNFVSVGKGTMQESKQYKNEVSFKGISVDVHRAMKKYLAKNRDKV